MTAPTNSFMMDMMVVTTTFAERMQGRGRQGPAPSSLSLLSVTSLSALVSGPARLGCIYLQLAAVCAWPAGQSRVPAGLVQVMMKEIVADFHYFQ